jgi:hypothetical protein
MKVRKTITPAVSEANRRNAERSTGPKTQRGKNQSRMNALRGGIFLKELTVSDHELPDFEAIRGATVDQLAPKTPLQNLAAQRVVACAWIAKLALRAQSMCLQTLIAEKNDVAIPKAATPLPGTPISELWAGGRADLRDRLRGLAWLREEITHNGTIHVDAWRADAVRLLGPEFLKTLMEWEPTVSEEVLKLAHHLDTHATKYHMPLPSELEPPLEREVIKNPMLQREMMTKLIEIKSQSLHELLEFEQQSAPKGSGTAEFAARYAARANRALEAAVRWFLFLRENEL